MEVFHLEETPSTMQEAAGRFRGVPVLVTADRQTAGRGRTGATWVHADRAVAASLAFAPAWDSQHHSLIPLVAGLSAAATFDVELKWPNDLIYQGLKAGGILVEKSGDTVVVGLGVNLFWGAPIAGATARFVTDPGAEAATRLATSWASDLVGRLEADPAAWGRSEYERLCVTIGTAVAWEPGGSGQALGVDERGRLVVETAVGLAVLDSGEVRHVRTT